MAPLERQPTSGYIKGEIIFPLSPPTTKETINKILSYLEMTFSPWRAEREMAEWPGQTHPPGAPPSGRFHRGLPLLFFTGTSSVTGLTSLIMLIVSLFLSELHSNPEKQHKCAKTFQFGETDCIFPVSTQAPRATLSSHLPASVGVLISPAPHHYFPLGSIFIVHFLGLFFPQHRPFQRAVTQRSFSAAQPPVGMEGGRRDQPCWLRHFQASTGPCCLCLLQNATQIESRQD